MGRPETKFASTTTVVCLYIGRCACVQDMEITHLRARIFFLNNTRVYPKFPDWPPGVRTANATALCH
jgi:hypothetical protein